MKIKPQTEALTRLLDLTSSAVKGSTTMPILSAILFEADSESDTLTVSATDTELSIRITAGGCEVETSGKSAIKAALLSNVVKSLTDETTEISATTSEATITTKTGSYAIKSYDPKDFPKFPDPPTDGQTFDIPAAALAEAVKATQSFTSKEPNRPVLTGAHVTFENDQFVIATTDAYRLAVATTPVSGGPKEKISAVIPIRALKEASRLAALTETIKVSITENAATFSAQGVSISTRLIAGNFPEYGRLVPKDFTMARTTPRAELLAALRRVNLFCAKASPQTPIRLSFTKASGDDLLGDQLVVEASSIDNGAAAESLAYDTVDPKSTTGDIKGAEDNPGAGAEDVLRVAFNPTYLISAATNTAAKEVLFKFNGPLKPALVLPTTLTEAGTKLMMLLMPMRDPSTEEGTEKATPEKPEPTAEPKAEPTAAEPETDHPTDETPEASSEEASSEEVPSEEVRSEEAGSEKARPEDERMAS